MNKNLLSRRQLLAALGATGVASIGLAGTTGAAPPVHTSGVASDGSISWAYVDTVAVWKAFGPNRGVITWINKKIAR